MADVRQRIIHSVFSKRNAAGTLEENYVAHVKIWEDAEAGPRKPRYILLSQAINGTGFLHKSKLNTNGTFSVGKTWRLADLRGLQVIDPLQFNITLSRTYRWQTESATDQAAFLQAVVRQFRVQTNFETALQLDGVPDYTPQNTANDSSYTVRSASPANPPPSSRNQTRVVSDTSNPNNRNPSPAPGPRRNGAVQRSESPAGSFRERRPPSLNLPAPQDAYPQPPVGNSRSHQQRPSNSTSSPSQPTLIQDANTRSIPDASQARPRIPQINRSNNASPVPSNSARPPPAPQLPKPVELPQPQQLAAAVTRRDRDQNARISYFDPTNQALLDRLISTNESQLDGEGEEENAQAILASVEEMIEGYEWASDEIMGRKMSKGAVDLIEARLLDELTALEKANVHSFLESDDRVALVMKFLDDALAELDNLDGLISTYKIHLNAVGDDISFIQSQNRGLQVQTQNQKALLAELENLLRTVHVDQDALVTLTQESMEKTQSIARLEEAVSELYKALQAGKDTDMAATMERLQEYRTHNGQFCKRIYDFLSIMFVAQSKLLLGDSSGLGKSGSRTVALPHKDLEAYLSRYAGLMLYLREMDEGVYSRLCASYFSAASDLHGTQIKALLAASLSQVKRATEEEQEQVFSPGLTPLSAKGAASSTMRRAGTLIRSPLEGRQRDRDRQTDGDLRASEVFGICLGQIATLIYQEDEFISYFLHTTDTSLTFADYMGLDNYFRRQAARSIGLGQNTSKLIRGALDLIFGFLPAEIKSWLDTALAKDNIEIIGILVFLERFMAEADEKGNLFVINFLEKQHSRLRISFERQINDQLKVIEQTKVSSKKRKGVAPFIKSFIAYTGRVEQQLIGADDLEIRTMVDAAYDKLVQTMFDSLKQMAKQEGEGEDKGQLNYHVILIENMHHFVAEISQTDVPSLAPFARRAEALYDENLSAYIRIIFRRPFGKLMDFFEGLDRVTKDSGDIGANSSYNKSALRRVTKEYSAKDVRKHIEMLAKRVEKHFIEGSDKTMAAEETRSIAPGTVGVGVWKACEDELMKLTEGCVQRIGQFYADSGVTLEYTAADVKGAFGRQRIGT